MIQAISGPISNGAPAAAAGVKALPEVRWPDGGEREPSRKPATDEYVPEEKQEPAGRYWLGKDEDGRPKIYFDDPERAADAVEGPEQGPMADAQERDQGAAAPEKRADDGKKSETCTGSTDRVDREIEKLKREKERLERQISIETDETKVKALEQKLAQVERELGQKDNDAYRRRHTEITVFS